LKPSKHTVVNYYPNVMEGE